MLDVVAMDVAQFALARSQSIAASIAVVNSKFPVSPGRESKWQCTEGGHFERLRRPCNQKVRQNASEHHLAQED